MDARTPPKSPAALAAIFKKLRLKKYERKEEAKKNRAKRRSLTKSDRERVLTKTASRCHICGGKIEGKWQADHVLAHSTGGDHDVDNYLPAHDICNNYRWDYSDVEVQYILKLGVWSRSQIENQTALGQEMAEKFVAHEHRRHARRQ